jgi:hypothetical protein
MTTSTQILQYQKPRRLLHNLYLSQPVGLPVQMSSANTVTFAGIAVDVNELDFDIHSSRVASVKTANITLIVLVGLFVGLRLFVRLHMVRKIFTDDGAYIYEDSLERH